jgi:hypothetical protein
MRLVVLVCCFHRRACPLGSQTTNRIFNYARDIPEESGLDNFLRACVHMWNDGGSDKTYQVDSLKTENLSLLLTLSVNSAFDSDNFL